jgi:gliding motility-associated-like protein
MTTTTYSVVGVSLAGCISNVVTSTVTVNTTPTISVNSGTICSGQSFTMTPSGAATYTYAGGSAVVSPLTSTSYTVIGESLAGCPSNVVTSNVTVYITPTITVNSGSICAGQSFTMTPSCVSAPVTSTLIVNQNPIVAISGKTVICSGKSTTLTLTGAATYSWSPATYLDTTVGSTVISTPKTSTVYTITATSAEGCVSYAPSPISVIQTPTISVSATQTLICEGESTSLATSGAFTFSWSPANSVSSVSSNPTTASPTVTTTYTVEGFNLLSSNSCVASNTVQVVVIPKVNPIIDPVLPICLGQSTTLKASGGTTYTWSPTLGLSKPTSSITIAHPTVTTLYTVKISKGGLCTREATVNVVVNPLPIVDAGKDTTVNIGESITLFGKGNVTVGFKPLDGPPLYCNYCSSVTVSPETTTCYELRGENSFGCVSTDEVCVKVTKDWNVYIPNAFTPDEDGHNEYFLPVGYGIAKMSLTIFDRWGAKLYYEESVERGWDGKYLGKLCKQDVYVYMVEIKALDGTTAKKTGHVTCLPK